MTHSTSRLSVRCGRMLILLLVFAPMTGSAQPQLAGDVNCDYAVDFRDINPFIAVLTGGDPPHADPVARYTLDGNLVDLSGAANHGFARGGLSFGPGIMDLAAQFNGTDSYIALSEPIPPAGRDYSIAFWLRVPPAAAGQLGYILHSPGAGGGSADQAFVITLDPAPEPALCIGQSGELLRALAAASVCDGLWHHVVFTRALMAMQVNCYLDGALAGSYSFTSPEITPLRSWVGTAVDGVSTDCWFTGELDALRVYDRVISTAEVVALALPTWRQRTTPAAPEGRHAHAMVYDPVRAVVFLFGGSDGSAAFNDTWVWDGLEWVQLAPSMSPEPRFDFGMAYDGDRNRVVLFGGRRANGTVLGDTWEYYDEEWHYCDVATAPAARAGCSMVYDAMRQRVILFGGRGAGSDFYADTWAWDGSAWTNLAPATNPSARAGYGMAYDVARDRVVLFGGECGGSPYILGDTWELDGETTTWTQVSSGGPAPRYAIGTIAYDPMRQRVVLFGNNDYGNPVPHYFQDMWTWDGAGWQVCPVVGPLAGSDGTVAYDEARKTLVLFGGFPAVGDTWECSLSNP